MRKLIITLATLVAFAPLATAEAASLRGSPAAMQQQNGVAHADGLDFYRTSGDILRAVEAGDLLRLEGNESYEVADFVSYPFLQPEAHLFVERLARQYRDACGEKLVVTSATRPSANQPANSHALSVHPAGMAVDLRVSQNAQCRSWLEAAMLGLEARGVINGIREFHPPHYHVAVFPSAYAEYAAERIAAERAEKAERLGRMAKAVRALDPTTSAGGIATHGDPDRDGLGILRAIGPVGIIHLAIRSAERLLGTA